MRLGELTSGLDVRVRDSAEAASLEVSCVVEDSRAAGPGALFIARAGRKTDGRAFIADVVSRGASAVLTDAEGEKCVPRGVGCVVSKDAARDGALMAERCAGEPTRVLHLVGVTGTNGKSTVVEFVQQLMRAGGKTCGLVGTVRVDDGRVSEAAKLTTPGAPELSGLFGRMVQHGCAAAAMEVSSHALDQDRVAGLRFRAAIFTNLTGDHQDYHGTMEAYAAAKAKLFAQLPSDGLAIVNGADGARVKMLEGCGARVLKCFHAPPPDPLPEGGGAGTWPSKTQTTAFGPSPVTPSACHPLPAGGAREQETARVFALEKATLEGVHARFEGPWGAIEARVPVIGEYNLANALYAVAAAFDAGVTPERIAWGLERLKMPAGRLERVRRGDVHVFVDYAHTDDALEHVLSAVRGAMAPDAKLHVVFGCGGDRDRTKRPRMGAAAARWGDWLYVTSDNPRREQPMAIIEEVLAGVPAKQRGEAFVAADRREAIERAIAEARAGDVVVIAGKGHETYQELSDGRGGTHRIVFDDRDVSGTALTRRGARSACTSNDRSGATFSPREREREEVEAR
ncbi:MAG: UDP-N-acetylmuramoyl-L-alanyl-D-glutamate--2,6-diaminopimelate ligase [Phycisphaerales bacterium]|nr:UDP-N-acetylmuramoyl-L-alanyl-D-glutamate--2,6-diaminopimelate ligase [Phycisphaerales bacterium]